MKAKINGKLMEIAYSTYYQIQQIKWLKILCIVLVFLAILFGIFLYRLHEFDKLNIMTNILEIVRRGME